MSLLSDFGDFIKTPEGQGLLSGVFGYAANAQRGTPINNLGRGGLAGLLGYSNAQERQEQTAENQSLRGYRQMQIDEMKRKIAEQQGQREWRTGLPAVLDQKVAVESDVGPSFGPDTAAINRYLLDSRSPFADEILKRKLFPKDEEPFTLSAGQVRYGAGGRVVAQAPAEDKTDSKIKQYEYARSNGYRGSFADFVAIGPSITAAALAPLRNAQIDSIQGNDAYKLPPPPPQTTGPVTVTVNGQAYQFPNQSAANSFKMKAGIK